MLSITKHILFFMYPTLTGLMFPGNITVICPCHCLFNIIWYHYASGWK